MPNKFWHSNFILASQWNYRIVSSIYEYSMLYGIESYCFVILTAARELINFTKVRKHQCIPSFRQNIVQKYHVWLFNTHPPTSHNGHITNHGEKLNCLEHHWNLNDNLKINEHSDVYISHLYQSKAIWNRHTGEFKTILLKENASHNEGKITQGEICIHLLRFTRSDTGSRPPFHSN